MKVKFSKSKSFTPAWNGNRDLPPEEQIQVTLKPMHFGDLMTLMDAMGGAKTIQAAQDGATPEELTNQVNITKVVSDTSDMLPRYAVLTGLEDDEGPVSMGDVALYPAYAGLSFEILMELANISMVSEKSEGNSQGQQG